MNTLRTIGGGAGQFAVAYAEPPVSPPLGGAPVPVPTTPSVPAASPPPSPTPAEEPQQPVEAQADETVAVFLNLKSGQRIWAGRFDTLELAEERAHEVVRGLIRPEPGVWAKFGSRFIRPSAVVSVELAARREDY